ncbi:MAG: hypothetical protein INR67_19000 [Jatrophihabitans endophyticus]|nr:hypothetical protein [Jatrophihabitans endophyticus]
MLADSAPPPVTFDALGVDLLLVDEAHYFKRLPVTTRRAGISLGSSQRAADLELKARTLRARRGGRPSLALFTGTPWSNTVAETFVWQTLVQPDVLRAAGVEQFDAWAAVFVEYESLVEVAPDSAGIRVSQRPSRVRNLPELVRTLNRSALVLPPAALPLARPERLDDTVVCEAGPGQRTYVGGLALRADKLRRERARGVPGGDNMLVLCSDGRRVALDPRLVGVDEDSPKVAAVADRVARIRRAGARRRFAGSDVPGLFQIVFCDQGTPGVDGPQTYGRLRVALAERGVPPERVRWVHEARTPAERTALFADCRSGHVSVLIGSTDTLGTGSNVQTRLSAVHHLDAPWRPSDVEQRDGRALRPGNLNRAVEIVRYVTRGTFDGYMWQTLERKARFIDDLRRGDTPERVADDIGDTVLSYAEVKALATGNELLLDHARAAADVARLRVLQAVARQGLTAARAELAAAEQRRYDCTQRERMLRSAAARLAAGVGDDGAVLPALEIVRARLRSPDDDAAPAPVRAPWHGLGIEVVPRGGWRAPRPREVVVRVTLAHRAVDEFALPTGTVRRDDSAVLHALQDWRGRVDGAAAEAAAGIDEADAAADRAARVIAGHRFEQHDALRDAEARLALITVALEASVDAVTAGPDAA